MSTLLRSEASGRGLARALLTTSTVLNKFFATWLVVLVVAPITAPFSTCDLASLLGRNPVQLDHASARTIEFTAEGNLALPERLGSTARRVEAVALSRTPILASDPLRERTSGVRMVIRV